MSISTKGFLHSTQAKEFTLLKLIDFIRDNYEITGVYPSGNDYTTISFNHNDDSRSLSVFSKYTSYANEGYPEFLNTSRVGGSQFGKKYIVLFTVNNWGRSEDIIKGFIQNFGGGFFLENDCSDDEWEVVL